jgi:basic membrane protein A
MKLPRFVSILVAPVVLSTAVFAADFAPAIIYDMGGKFDKSFNQSASDGTVRFKKETGIEVREFEVTNAAQREQAMTRFAQRGSQVIVAIGFPRPPPSRPRLRNSRT